MSGWLTSRKTINVKIVSDNRYFKYPLTLLSETIIFATKSMNSGFTISTGWNCGKKNRLSHLFEPLISTPKKGTRKRKRKEIKKKGNKNFSIFFFALKWNYK